MGQAKKRGTFEERKEAAIEDNRKTIQLLREQEEAWWNSLTPEEQEAVAKKRVERMHAMAALSKLTAAANGGYRSTPSRRNQSFQHRPCSVPLI